MKEDLNKLIVGTRKSGGKSKQRRKKNKDRFRLFRFKRYDYEEGSYRDPKTIKGVLNVGFKWIKKEFDKKDENKVQKLSLSGFWTRLWLRFIARKKLKELNRQRSKWKVRGKIKGDKNKSDDLPVPRFKLKWISKRSEFGFTLKLNPVHREKILRRSLVYSDFKKTWD